MNTYTLKRLLETSDIYFDNGSPMYPTNFERLINELAGEQITAPAPPLGGFFGSFINTFVVKKDKEEIFWRKVFPNIGNKDSADGVVVWNKNEEVEACQI